MESPVSLFAVASKVAREWKVLSTDVSGIRHRGEFGQIKISSEKIQEPVRAK